MSRVRAASAEFSVSGLPSEFYSWGIMKFKDGDNGPVLSQFKDPHW